jgi:hypothetical protein
LAACRWVAQAAWRWSEVAGPVVAGPVVDGPVTRFVADGLAIGLGVAGDVVAAVGRAAGPAGEVRAGEAAMTMPAVPARMRVAAAKPTARFRQPAVWGEDGSMAGLRCRSMAGAIDGWTFEAGRQTLEHRA